MKKFVTKSKMLAIAALSMAVLAPAGHAQQRNAKPSQTPRTDK